jgi:hypothetical protein
MNSNRKSKMILVPKLCLGTHLSSKLRFAAGQQSCRDNGIPKQSLGTRKLERRRSVAVTRDPCNRPVLTPTERRHFNSRDEQRSLRSYGTNIARQSARSTWFVAPFHNFLVPKLCLGTHLSSKLCFATGATELRGQWCSQTEFGNEEIGGSCAPRAMETRDGRGIRFKHRAIPPSRDAIHP